MNIDRQIFLVAAAFVVCNASAAHGQQEKLITPQPEHKLLERFAGEWKFERLSVPDGASKPETLGSGEVHAEMLGGFFVVCRWTGNLYGTDYKAVQTLGFDVNKSEYAGTWVDSAMSYQWPLRGSVDNASKELVVEASGPNASGGTMKYRERYRFESNDSITITAQMLEGEKWVTFMTTNLTRKKDSKSNPPQTIPK
jgi:hypothetical protein